MPVDLLLKNGLLSNNRRADLAIDGGLICEVGEGLAVSGRQEVNLAGMVVLPGLTDVHHHLDKAYTFDLLGGGDSLLGAAGRMRSYLATMTVADVYERGRTLLDRMIRHGVCAARTHVDLNLATGLRSIEAILALRQAYADRIRLQVVAFPPGDADIQDPQVNTLVRKAVAMGCDVIGGVPSLNSDPHSYMDALLGLAQEYDCLVDMHVDEAGTPSADVLESLAKLTCRAGLIGRVTAGHCSTLAVVEDSVADRVIEQVRLAQMSIVTCPLTNLYLQGGGERVPGFRGLTRVRDLLQAGVNVCCGSDNVRDPFNPYGNGDPLLAALVAGLACRLGTSEEQEALIGTVTEAGARAMHLNGYGLATGCRADLVALPGCSTSRLLADLPSNRLVVLNGRLIE